MILYMYYNYIKKVYDFDIFYTSNNLLQLLNKKVFDV